MSLDFDDIDNVPRGYLEGGSGSDEESCSESGSEDGSDSENDSDDGSGSEDGSESGSEDGSGSENDSEGVSDSEEAAAGADGDAGNWYRPREGEDIYGRSTVPAAEGVKPALYVPPALRKAQAAAAAVAAEAANQSQSQGGTTTIDSVGAAGKPLAIIDLNSDAAVLTKKLLNGMLNRLSSTTKDSVAIGIKGIYDKHSNTLTNHVLKECVFQACSNSSQLMTTLIPTYAAVIASLHISVSSDIGAFLLEHLVLNFHSSLKKGDAEKSHSLILNKMPLNYLLFVVYLYNLRIVHHSMIFDILDFIVTLRSDSDPGGLFDNEIAVECIVLVLQHAGLNLRKDDPNSLITLFTSITSQLKQCSEGVIKQQQGQDFDGNSDTDGNSSGSRLHYLSRIITDVKNNKNVNTNPTSAAAIETTKLLRKWLGSIKQQLSNHKGNSGGFSAAASTGNSVSGGSTCLTMSLQDLLEANTRGRWWKAGASWIGRRVDGDQSTTKMKEIADIKQTPVKVSAQEIQLLKIAKQMRGINTDVRRKIFVILMSSMNVDDAFERIEHLQLKGKQDREIILVILECCLQESAYNPFYAAVTSVFCDANRQFKTTCQFAIWDHFRVLTGGVEAMEGDGGQDSKVQKMKRYRNLGRFISSLTRGFHLSLGILKPIDLVDLQVDSTNAQCLTKMLSVLFETMLSQGNIDDDSVWDQHEMESIESIFDRISTGKDCIQIRDFCVYVITKLAFTSGHSKATTKVTLKRKRRVLKLLDQMSILDLVVENPAEAGDPDENEEGIDNDTGGNVNNGDMDAPKAKKARTNKGGGGSRRDNEAIASMGGGDSFGYGGGGGGTSRKGGKGGKKGGKGGGKKGGKRR